MTVKELVSQLTLEEKASLCSGKDFWKLKSVERLGLRNIMVTDGPHGLRKQATDSDHLGISESVPATCFPAACATASSFNRALLEEIGEALGEECLQEKVAVILGPGVNIKRSPLCGRNFEYFSEDPFVAGELAAALIRGVQQKGVGTSLKHYAANNQEKARLSCNSVIDERALREIYLSAFEIAVKKGKPWTVMCSYNLINGIYACEHKKLLIDILRTAWGFQGLVMTDWGAIDDRVEALKAGLDLEMPGSGGDNDARIVRAVKNGDLDETVLDVAVTHVVSLILKSQDCERPDYHYDAAAHHALARKAAADSAVLLKNDAILPIKRGQSLAVIGAFAKTPRYQGSGSSRINPPQIDNSLDALTSAGIPFDYAEGYSLAPGSGPDEALIAQACAVAAGKDAVLIFAGLPDDYESEGFDRTALDMPESHNRLIEAVSRVNPNVVVILQVGAPVLTPWSKDVKAILLLYLGGQAVGSAVADLISGAVAPSGKLAETWPLALSDTPCYHYFPGKKTAEYRESIFVGYRYYDSVQKPVAYPFGYGLSYTTFEYSALKVSAPSIKAGGSVQISFKVKNSGAVAGAEIVQVYVKPKDSAILRVAQELKAFEKIFLNPGQEETVNLLLDDRSFAYYHAPNAVWALESGTYHLCVGASSRDIRLQADVNVCGDGFENLLADQRTNAPDYFNLPDGALRISDSSFTALYGQALPPSERIPGEPFTINSTIDEVKDTDVGKQFLAAATARIGHMFSNGEAGSDVAKIFEQMLIDAPLRNMVIMGGGAISFTLIYEIVDLLNGKISSSPLLDAFLNS
ncbi:MAG: glycoside hydrolase family 3 C-terminal domain-containing protein [Treponema sp.]|nr:glycoside hydrolase family 3 C-terminal domain-containing protein [Treponema sp.]